jgi:predicted metal-binding membrane protein
MLLMFAVGAGHIGWMLALGAVMAVEKNMPWGRRISRPLGLVLLAWALGAAILAPVWAASGGEIDQVIRWVCHT